MESSIVKGAERQSQPPVLPTKQRRSQYSSSSGVDLEHSENGMCSPPWAQHHGYTSTDVFSEPTDCHTSQCPIHQLYGYSSCHQERFFSDDTPPPVPKKKLARTLSLPGTYGCPTAPLFTRSQPYNFDNPLYMLTFPPKCPSHADKEKEREVEKTPLTLQRFAALSFDTPDEHLPHFFSCFENQADIFQGIQHRHLLFLRSKAQSLEAMVLLQEASENAVGLFQPQDLILSGDCKPKQIGADIYYELRSPQLPARLLAAKVNKTPSAPLIGSTHLPLHANIQQVIIHFTPDAITLNQQKALQTKDFLFTSVSFQSNPTATKQAGGGSRELDNHRDDSLDSKDLSVLSMLQNGYAVTIERDLPQATLIDFVEESRLLPSSELLLYERQLCTLLVQLVAGLRHLLSHAVPCGPLKPQDVLLVWPRWLREETASGLRTGIKENTDSDGRQLLSGTIPGQSEEDMPWNKGEKTEGYVQMLWRKWGSPRVVLAHQSTTLSSPHHPLPSILTHLQEVLQYCLQPVQENQSCHLEGYLYLQGLLQLSSLPQKASTEVKLEDVVGVLQALLWGPRAGLFTLNDPSLNSSIALNNWLSIKRALMLLKVAERGLVSNQSGLYWDDYLCLHYLSFTDAETMKKAIAQVGLHTSNL